MNYSIKVLLTVLVLAVTVSACSEQSSLEPESDNLAPRQMTENLDNSEKLALKGQDRPVVAAKNWEYNGCLEDGTQGAAISRGYSLTGNAELYHFNGSAGDNIGIAVHRLTSAMDPVMYVFQGTVSPGDDLFSTLPLVGGADDNNGVPHGVGGSYADPYLSMTLPATDVYTVAIWDFIGAGPGPFTPFEVHTSGISCILNVTLDVKPDDSSNRLNSRSKGVIPAAILSTDGFDASTIDVASLSFGPGGAAAAHDGGHAEDVNGDGLDDLMLHFDTQASGLAKGDTQVCVTGTTLGGAPLQGCDSVDVSK